eukprot:scaffold12402_cov134-Isochrysis_galbana.AAC.3
MLPWLTCTKQSMSRGIARQRAVMPATLNASTSRALTSKSSDRTARRTGQSPSSGISAQRHAQGS